MFRGFSRGYSLYRKAAKQPTIRNELFSALVARRSCCDLFSRHRCTSQRCGSSQMVLPAADWACQVAALLDITKIGYWFAARRTRDAASQFELVGCLLGVGAIQDYGQLTCGSTLRPARKAMSDSSVSSGRCARPRLQKCAMRRTSYDPDQIAVPGLNAQVGHHP